MPQVELFHWNPERPKFRGPIGRRLPFRSKVNNFGDMLGPEIVRGILRELGLSEIDAEANTRLFSIGSVLHEARATDHVWGSGVNGKEVDASYDPGSWKIHAVRGTYTRDFLAQRGASVPDVFGDPGILTSRYFPTESLPAPAFSADVTIVPNIHDYPRYAHLPNVLNPRLPLEVCLATIAASKFVVGSSLHGIIVAESYGVPARPIQARKEPTFKYDDYFSGTSRSPQAAAKNVKGACEMGPVEPGKMDFDGLLDAFPSFLWSSGNIREA